jgi:hypothetical protein
MLQSGPLRPTIIRTSRFACLGTRVEGRHKSITAAIERGRISGDRELEFAASRERRGARPPFRGDQRRLDLGSRGSERAGRAPYRPSTHGPRTNESSYATNHQREYDDHTPRRGAARIESLPYTTAASEFIYGHSSVLAAIKANRRKFHKLYIHARGVSHPGINTLVARAKGKVDVREVGDEYLQAFDKASSGRPHNVGSPCVMGSQTAHTNGPGLHP